MVSIGDYDATVVMDRTLIPHGDTMLRPGDLFSVFLHREDEEALCDCPEGKK